jgi:uncharacterized iron-regulated protein
MKTSILLVFLTIFISVTSAQDKPAYKLFDKNGKQIKYSKMVNQLVDADIVFFGELHNDPIAHWLQLEVTKSLYEEKRSNLILGAEMFEADNQLLLDEYLAGIHETKKFEAEMRLWNNYQTDYKPLVEFAKENNLHFVASNIPRRYAALIHKKGFEGLDELSDEAKRYISPDLTKYYDPNVNCYKNMLGMMGMVKPEKKQMPEDSSKIKHNGDTTLMKKPEMSKKMMNHFSDNLIKAQASKDATMAHFILQNYMPGKLFIHFQGVYHSDNYEGIVWWIRQFNPDLKIVTISTVLQKDIEKLSEDNINIADYIIVVPETMTRTY